MSPTISLCAAPSARQRTRPLTRIGLAEGRKSRTEESHCLEACEASNYTSGSTTAWESENDEPMADLIGDTSNVLERLECRGTGKNKGTIGDTFSVRHALFGRSFPGFGYNFPTKPT
jgi:hypothetical protein